MEKLYDRIDFHNNTTPALNESNLNAMSKAIDDIDDRVVSLAGDVLTVVPQIAAYLEQAQDLEEALEQLSQNPPYIGENGNWYVFDTNTEEYVDSGVDASISVTIADVTALAPDDDPYVTNTGTDTDPIFHLFIPRGANGTAGVGISSIAKTGTSGNVDTYTITLTNGDTYDFTVTNASDLNNYLTKANPSGTGNLTMTGGASFGDDVTVNNTKLAKEKELKLGIDEWVNIPPYSSWTNYLQNATLNKDADIVITSGTTPIGSTVDYDVPTGWKSLSYLINDPTTLAAMVGKTIEFGAVTYEATFEATNLITLKYTVTGEGDTYIHSSTTGQGSENIPFNHTGVAIPLTIPEGITAIEMYYVSATHSPISVAGTLELGDIYAFDINEYVLPDQNNSIVEVNRHDATAHVLHNNSINFSKDRKIRIVDNAGNVIIYDCSVDSGTWLTQSAAIGATSVSFTDTSISSTSTLDLYSQNTSGTMIPYESVSINNHTATFTISALEEATTFKLWVRNI